MDSEEDSTAGICNVSLGREIMQVVQSNESQNNNAAKQKVNMKYQLIITVSLSDKQPTRESE